MFKALLRTRLAALFAGFKLSRRKKKNGTESSGAGIKILIGLLIVYLICCFFFLFFTLWESMFVLIEAGLPWLFYSAIYITAFGLAFIGSVFSTYSQLFLAKDNELLLAMPIKPSAVIGSRMAALLLFNAILAAIIVIPAIIVIMIHSAITVGGTLILLLVFLVLPFETFTLSAVFAFIIAKLSPFFAQLKIKNILITLLYCALFAGYFIVISNAQRYIADFVSNADTIALSIRSAVLPVYWLGDAIASLNVGELFLHLAICILPFAAVYYILSKSFLKIVTATPAGSSTGQRTEKVKISSASSALLKRELRRFVSSTTFFLNGGIGIIMLIIASAVCIIKAGSLNELLSIIPGITGSIASQLLCLPMLFLLSMTIISGVTISLDGKTFWITRSVPLPARMILTSKVRAQSVITVPASLIASAAICIAVKPSPLAAVGTILLPALFACFSSRIGVMINIRFHNFDWINETYVIKQSASVLVTMLVNLGITLLLAGLGIMLIVLVPSVSSAAALMLSAPIAAAVFISDFYLNNGGSRKFEALDC